MFITTYAKASELMGYMGSEATELEAKHMLRILAEEGFQNIETSEIPEDKWLEMLETAVRFAEENGE